MKMAGRSSDSVLRAGSSQQMLVSSWRRFSLWCQINGSTNLNFQHPCLLGDDMIRGEMPSPWRQQEWGSSSSKAGEEWGREQREMGHSARDQVFFNKCINEV